MKLLLENWRQYLNESENSSHYGDLYLFENDTVTKTSFYDALNTLSESDGVGDTFLENWEKSVDYQLQNLNEQDFNPLFKLATQAWMIQDKFKEKAAEKVIAVSKKINDYSEKNPKTVKVAKVVVGGLLAAAAVYYIYKVVDKGGDASDVMELAQSLQPEDPDLAREVAECAQEFSPEKIAEFAQEQQNVVDKVADTLSAAGEPALDQMGQAAEAVSDDMTQEVSGLDRWAEMFDSGEFGKATDAPELTDKEARDTWDQLTGQDKFANDPSYKPGGGKKGLDDWSKTWDKEYGSGEDPVARPARAPQTPDEAAAWEDLLAQDKADSISKTKPRKWPFKKFNK
jgi:hypothetical protein